jgi:hypothetical protein
MPMTPLTTIRRMARRNQAVWRRGLPAAAALILVAAGWDPGLQMRCVASPHPDQENYYEYTRDCYDHRRWLVAVHSGNGTGTSCPGPAAQSFPINAEGSPASLGWKPSGEGWAVTLTTDFAGAHPCGDGYWTWFMFQDHERYHGGPFPRPDQLLVRAVVNYHDTVSGGSAKGIARWQGWWDGRGRVVELVFASEGLGDNYPNDPLVIQYLDGGQQYVLVDGAAMRITASEGVTTQLTVPWRRVIERLVRKGYLDTPSSWAETKSTGVGLGHEVKGNQEASLWFADFRVEAGSSS